MAEQGYSRSSARPESKTFMAEHEDTNKSYLPTHTEGYLKARAPLLAEFKRSCAPHWERFCRKEISHAEYCELIQPAFAAYSKALDPHWRRAGGATSY